MTTTYAEVEAEIGDLAKSEEDVLMYALFPNEATTYLTAHQEGAEKAVFLMSEELHTVKEDDSVDVNQIRELIKVVEASDVSEIVIEEGDTKVVGPQGRLRVSRTCRRGRRLRLPAAGCRSPPPPRRRPPASARRRWKTVTAPMVGTFYEAASPGLRAVRGRRRHVRRGRSRCASSRR